MRIKAFRHVHDLPVLTQSTERRGALVSRVTWDVDTVSQFLQFGGHLPGQHRADAARDRGDVLLLWQLALVVLICFLPLFLPGYFQRRMSRRTAWSGQVGEMLSAIAEPVVGAR